MPVSSKQYSNGEYVKRALCWKCWRSTGYRKSVVMSHVWDLKDDFKSDERSGGIARLHDYEKGEQPSRACANCKTRDYEPEWWLPSKGHVSPGGPRAICTDCVLDDKEVVLGLVSRREGKRRQRREWWQEYGGL